MTFQKTKPFFRILLVCLAIFSVATVSLTLTGCGDSNSNHVGRK